MRSLFWKIFGWFWGAMLLIGLTLYLLVLTTRPDPLPQPWRETAGTALYEYARTALEQWRMGGRSQLAAYLLNAGRRSQSFFWLYDAEGRELSGNPLPPFAPDTKLLPPPMDLPSTQPRKTFPLLETPERLDALRRALLDSGDKTTFEHHGPRVLVAQSITQSTTRGRQSFVLIGSMPTPHFGRRVAEPGQQLLGGLALLALSTLVCYGLVRYLTAPILSLREATRAFAAGQLSTRVTPRIGHRRDELTELARDFDEMAERIEVLLTSQRRLLGDVSHELRSPLARLSMALGLARRHAENGSPELQGALERIGREKERLNALIGQLLDLTRLESGEYSAPHETIDLTSLLCQVAQDADFEARAHNRRVLVTSAEACQLLGSRELLGRAIENVIRNAVSYTQPETSVEVSIEVQAKYSIICVRDHGPGVPEESLDKLFQPFYRVATARDRQSGGVGLGLAITERAIRSHGGTVLARNAEGGGLEIKLTLPLNASTPR